jgi:hypothetical protein
MIDTGTPSLLLGKLKLITLANALYNQAAKPKRFALILSELTRI